MWMRTLALHLVLLATARLCLSQIAISAVQAVITLPADELQNFAVLTCRVEPNDTVESQWRLPSGELLAEGNHPRHSVQDGSASLGGMMMELRVTIIINQISYQDAGNYTCEARPEGDTGEFVSATVELRTRVQIEAQNTSVDVFDNATQVELSCEMTLFIRPDEDLQWSMAGQAITIGTGKYTISVRDGTPTAAVNGSEMRVPGRVSVLTIFNPEESDSGTYTCSIAGTSESDTVELSVVAVGGQPPPTTVTGNPTLTVGPSTPTTVIPQPTGTEPTPAAGGGDDEIPLPAIIGGIAGFLGIIVIILIVVIIVVAFRKRSNSVELLHENGAYDSAPGKSPPYAQVVKSVSPPPPIPTRAQTNTISSLGSEFEIPGYDVPDVTVKGIPMKEKPNYDLDASTKYDPYYDNPEDVSRTRVIPPSKGPKAYYDEVEMFGPGAKETKFNSGGYDMRSVPSPAMILSGSLQRQLEQRNPDFAYPTQYQDGFSVDDFPGEPDYDQIYSEPLDPTMLHHEYEMDTGSFEAVPYSAIYEDPQPLLNIEPLLVTKDHIIEIRKLGMGQFGNVILAKTRGLSLKDMRLSETDADRNKSILVAIKKLKPDAETGLMEAFEKEVKFMSRLGHDNVVRLLGVCRGPESFIMMEYMENGDLNQFLQKQRLMPDTISGLQENEVTPIILLYMGVQIASGMHYLASRRFVHRDLATRNCLMGKDFIVKISDFGMSRSLYESAYYRVQGTLVLPIRWMACETFYGKFSVKSDAWAFGVVLWEIYTLGRVDPYDTMTDEEVIADSIRGPDRKLLERPEACPQEVYDIMARCWVHEPSMRADFGEIYSRLFLIYTRQAL